MQGDSVASVHQNRSVLQRWFDFSRECWQDDSMALPTSWFQLGNCPVSYQAGCPVPWLLAAGACKLLTFQSPTWQATEELGLVQAAQSPKGGCRVASGADGPQVTDLKPLLSCQQLWPTRSFSVVAPKLCSCLNIQTPESNGWKTILLLTIGSLINPCIWASGSGLFTSGSPLQLLPGFESLSVLALQKISCSSFGLASSFSSGSSIWRNYSPLLPLSG